MAYTSALIDLFRVRTDTWTSGNEYLIAQLQYFFDSGSKVSTGYTQELSQTETVENGFTDTMQWTVPQVSMKTFEVEVINITRAEHLDADYQFISDIYSEVRAQDGVWRWDLNENGRIADAGDLVLMTRAVLGEIVLI